MSYFAAYAAAKPAGRSAPFNGTARPSSTATSSPLSRWTTTSGRAAMFRAFSDSGSVENQNASSIQSPHTGIACGRPSMRVVHTQ